MELVDVWDQERWQQEEQENVAKDEVRGEETHLRDLAQEFTSGLRDRVPAERVPLAGPPCYVGCVGTEFSRQGEGDDKLVDESLDGDRRDHAQKSLGKAPAFQEEHDFEECQHHDDCDGVCNGSQDSTKLLAAHAEDWSHTASHTEEASGNTSVDTNRSKRNNGDTDERVGWREVLALVVRLNDTSTSVDVEVGDQSDGDQDEWTNNFTKENVGELRTRCVTRQLGRWLSKCLALETSETSTRETHESNP